MKPEIAFCYIINSRIGIIGSPSRLGRERCAFESRVRDQDTVVSMCRVFDSPARDQTASLAQSGERMPVTHEARGSKPLRGANSFSWG